MTALSIWLIASSTYAVFFCWYTGFKKVITAAEVDAAMVRYRSRRDLMEILPETLGSAHYALKLKALDKTIAFPAAP